MRNASCLNHAKQFSQQILLTVLEKLLWGIISLSNGRCSCCCCCCCWGSRRSWHSQNIKAACGASLLALEPGAQTASVKNMVTWQLFAGLGHLFPADDAHIVSRCQFFRCGICIPTKEKVHKSRAKGPKPSLG